MYLQTRPFLTGAVILLLTGGLCFASGDEQKKRIKKRVAVFVFDDKTDKSFYWWNRKSVGEGISDMIITELVKSGCYQVLEREQIDAIINEQDLGTSGSITPESAAKVGQLLGVELAVMGAVTEFGYKKGSTGGRMKGLGLGVQNQSATVALDCRMVNTSTGVIVSAEGVRKEKSTKGIKVDTRTLDFKSQKDFDESLVGKAAREAVRDVIKLVNKNAPEIPWQAKVVQEQNGVVYINAGSKSGVQAGDRFYVYRKGDELVDPDTGLSLGSIDQKIGEIKVTDPGIGNGKASACSIVSGSGFQRGDLVRLE